MIGDEGDDKISGGDGSDEIIGRVLGMTESQEELEQMKFWEEMGMILSLEITVPTLLWVELLMT